MRHGVCLWGGVEDKYTCSLRSKSKSVRSPAQSTDLCTTFVIATLASSVTLQFAGRQSLISFDTTGVGRLRSSGLSAIIHLFVSYINKLLKISNPRYHEALILLCVVFSVVISLEVWFGFPAGNLYSIQFVRLLDSGMNAQVMEQSVIWITLKYLSTLLHEQ